MSINQDLTHVQSMWGVRILDKGFTNLPNLIIRHATRVGLSKAEFHLISIILTFKHDTEDPFPSQETIAKYYFGDNYKPGTSERSIRRILESLEEKGLILIGYKYNERGKRACSVYNFEPLIEAVLELDVVENQEQPEEKVYYKKGKKQKDENSTTGTKTSGSADIKNSTTGTKTSGSTAEKRPTKKNSLKRDIKKTIKKESQSIHDKVSALEISDSIKDYLREKEDGLTDHKLSVIESLYKKNLVADDEVFLAKLKKVFGYNPASNAFKKYLETSLEKSKDEQKAPNQPTGRKIVREEKLPESIKKQQEEQARKAEQEPKTEVTTLVQENYKPKVTVDNLIEIYNDPAQRETLSEGEKDLALYLIEEAKREEAEKNVVAL